MATWQTKRCKKQRRTNARPQPSQAQLRAKRARADAARMAGPAPIYPAEYRPGEWRGYVLWVIDGITTRVDLHQPTSHGRRSRCDSFDARDGDRTLIVGGLHAVHRAAISEMLPRALSRRAVAGMLA